MRKLFLLLAVLLPLTASAQVNYSFTEASGLTLVGKLMDTPNPYHRVDTVMYKGFTKGENVQVRSSSGISVAFKTNSPVISVKTEYGYMNFGTNTGGYALRGYDLYIKKDGKWLWAGSNCPAPGKENGSTIVIADHLDGTMKECLLYLPIYSEEYSVRIGIAEDSEIAPGEMPFRHRIGVFGSSYTQGISISRAGMTWPAQFSRMTGLQLLSLGCSGNSKLQPYFADVLADADVDAFIFDSFSNPNPATIKERLFPFIEKIQSKHPGKPLIFIQTIYRERRNFDTAVRKSEQDKLDMAEKMMAEAVKKYSDVYYVRETNATAPDHEAQVDGTHPSDYGYRLWAESIRKPVLKILKKYGIR